MHRDTTPPATRLARGAAPAADPGPAATALRWARRLLAGGGTALLALVIWTYWVASRSRPELPDSPLPIPPPLPPARILNVPGRGEFFLREAGDPAKPTVLLLHGWMYPADLNWFPSYGPLAEDHHVLAVDHRGHGRGPRPSQPYRLTDVADDAAAVLTHLGVGPVIAVGYSMGGPIAQLLWQRHPGCVRGLVLCATSAVFNDDLRDRLVWRAMGMLQVILRLVPRHWWERLYLAQARGALPIKVSRMVSEETPPQLRALLPWIVGELDRDSAEDVAEAGRELSRYDARGWIASIDVPTAVLVTTRDQLVPVDRQRDMAHRIPGAMVYELPIDHDGAIAKEEVFVPALRRAVSAVLGDELDGRPPGFDNSLRSGSSGSSSS